MSQWPEMRRSWAPWFQKVVYEKWQDKEEHKEREHIGFKK